MVSSDFSLSSPWALYAKKLETFFAEDPDISVEYDDKKSSDVVTIRVDNQDKYYALTQLLKTEIAFGKDTFKIDICPANFKTTDKLSLFKMAFKDNPVVKSISSGQSVDFYNVFYYILFRNEVVKYWSDNLGDPNGNSFTLFENLADEIFKDHPGILFTTAEE